MEQNLEEAEMEHDEDKEGEEFDAVDENDLEGDDGPYIPISTALFDTISLKELFNQDPHPLV